MVLPDPFQGLGREKLNGGPAVGLCLKVCIKSQKRIDRAKNGPSKRSTCISVPLPQRDIVAAPGAPHIVKWRAEMIEQLPKGFDNLICPIIWQYLPWS